jgi:hypothetical protein
MEDEEDEEEEEEDEEEEEEDEEEEEEDEEDEGPLSVFSPVKDSSVLCLCVSMFILQAGMVFMAGRASGGLGFCLGVLSLPLCVFPIHSAMYVACHWVEVI